MINIRELVKQPEYDFLREDEHLKDNIMFLCVGGSHSYGTNVEDSDIDIRGVCFNKAEDLLGLSQFEQYTNKELDTTIYSFNKFMKLIINCNPNIIEMLGCRTEDYNMVSPLGQKLLDNVDLFLTKKAFYSFGGYATSQLKELEKGIVNCHRTESAMTPQRINKHAMHLIRLYMMCYDILENHRIVTYRSEKERELLLDIRNGKYSEDGVFNAEFYSLVNTWEDRMKGALAHCTLPDEPNMDLINEFMVYMNLKNLVGDE